MYKNHPHVLGNSTVSLVCDYKGYGQANHTQRDKYRAISLEQLV